jgi:sec-independent protein translocase protein TatA
MMSFSHLLLLLVIVLVLFGAGKLPKVMGDIGKGIHNMREGLKGEGEEANAASQKTLPHTIDSTVAAQEAKDSRQS